jgi:hypothetical protein
VVDHDSEEPERFTPHDALFKLVFERPEHAAGILRSLLPAEVVTHLDLSTLELVPGSFANAELRNVEADLLYRVKLEGREAFVYVLLEHQSTVDPTMAFRLLRYMVRIWESWARAHPQARVLPPILPLVVTHGEAPWAAPRSLIELFGLSDPLREALAPLLVNFRYAVEDLAAADVTALRLRPDMSLMGRLTLFLLQRTRRSGNLFAELDAWRDVLEQLRIAGGDDLMAVVVYTRVVARLPRSRWGAFFGERFLTKSGDTMTMADRFIEMIRPWLIEQSRNEGLAAGMAEGRAEGKAEGKAEVLLRLLNRKFGPQGPGVEQRVRAASSEELDAMAERVLDSPNADDVLKG